MGGSFKLSNTKPVVVFWLKFGPRCCMKVYVSEHQSAAALVILSTRSN